MQRNSRVAWHPCYLWGGCATPSVHWMAGLNSDPVAFFSWFLPQGRGIKAHPGHCLLASSAPMPPSLSTRLVEAPPLLVLAHLLKGPLPGKYFPKKRSR